MGGSPTQSLGQLPMTVGDYGAGMPPSSGAAQSLGISPANVADIMKRFSAQPAQAAAKQSLTTTVPNIVGALSGPAPPGAPGQPSQSQNTADFIKRFGQQNPTMPMSEFIKRFGGYAP